MKYPTQDEVKVIVEHVRQRFDDIAARYTTTKYPEDVYDRVLASFRENYALDADVRDALVWKWGHWGKKNIPNAHEHLILEVQRVWKARMLTDKGINPGDVFES